MIITLVVFALIFGVAESIASQNLIVHSGTTVINHGLLRLPESDSLLINNIIVNENGEFVLASGTVIEIPDTLLVKKHGRLLVSQNAGVITLSSETYNARIILEDSARYANLSNSMPLLEVQREFKGSKGWRMLAFTGCYYLAGHVRCLHNTGFYRFNLSGKTTQPFVV